jgi:hypothetical protein
MTARPIPKRHWRSYGDAPLPSGAEALDEPFSAFPSWFMRITCDRCGQERMFTETHAAQGDMLIRDIIATMRHDGCGGRAGQGREGGAAHRHRGRQQPASAPEEQDEAEAEVVRATIDELKARLFGNLFVELPELYSRHCAVEAQS